MERLLVFVNNKKVADILMDLLEEDFPEQFGVIHSNKSQNYRLNTMASFQAGEIRGIVTTDIMARGLDISDITHVINIGVFGSAGAIHPPHRSYRSCG